MNADGDFNNQEMLAKPTIVHVAMRKTAQKKQTFFSDSEDDDDFVPPPKKPAVQSQQKAQTS